MILSRLDPFADRTGVIRYAPKQVVFTEGEPGSLMYVILAGEVLITAEGWPIDRLATGSIFGEMAMIDDRPRSATATAVAECTLLPLDRAGFASLMHEHPDMGLEVMTIMSVRLRRLMIHEVQKQRQDQELAIGRQIQLSLLPQKFPEIPGWQIAAVYRAARHVGGDLYDFVLSRTTPPRLNLVVADVTGKGVPAALFMASLRTLIRVEAARGHAPAEILRRANEHIIHDMSARLFLSAFQATLDSATGQLTYANAGHDWPLWWQAARGEVRPLPESGVLLGAFQAVQLQDHEIVLQPGDTLILYTDGVTEARNAAGELFGENRLEAVVAGTGISSAREHLTRIEDAVTAFTGDTPQSDDFTLVVIRRES